MNETIEQQLIALLKQKKSIKFYAQRMSVSEDVVREGLERLRKKKLREADEINDEIEGVKQFEEDIQKNTGTLLINSKSEITNLQELIEKTKIDINVWEITKYVQNYWGNASTPYWQVKAWLSKKTTDLGVQKDILLEELKTALVPSQPIERISKPNGKYAYEIDIFDHHFGKLAWDEESGDNYDLDIATKRWNDAIDRFLSYVQPEMIEEFILPIGNDLINVDSRRNETYAGTRQDSDSRFYKIIRRVKEVMIFTISRLAEIAPVKVIMVAGNHDPETVFSIGEILDAFYTSNPNVTVDNSAKQRKYYQYGLNGILYSHGNEESHKDLGLIFATEEPFLWAATKYRVCKLGHFHKNKKLIHTSIDEHQGFQVQIIPSLSGSDAWHASKGYRSLKQAKSFLYCRDKGEIAQFTYTV